MAPSLNDYEFQFDDVGTTLNTDDMGLPFIDILSVSGLDTAPLRTSTDEHQGMDGTYVDSPFVSARTIVLTGNLYTNPSDPDSLLDSLRADYTKDDVRPFYFQLPNRPTRFINCQGGGFRYDIDGGRRAGLTAIQATLVAEDPYIYDAIPASITIAVPTLSILGMSFNVAFNLGFGGALPNFGATVTNNGNHTAYPLITITGPVTNPVIVDSNSGTTMALNISLAAGDILTIDTRLKSIILNNFVSRRTSMTGRQWISVPPGVSDTISFTADAGTGSCTVKLYNTYY
jgi:hypothetical protein